MTVPGDVPQLLIFLIFVILGSVYQAVRSRLRGPTPDDQDVTNKLLRAIAFSAGLNALYAVFLGRWLLRFAERAPADPRLAGLVGFALMVGIPSLFAFTDAWRLRRGWTLRATYDPTPQAWDFMFKDRESCFVRVRTKEGQWVGGWFGPNSFASSYPEPKDLYIESAYLMQPDGSFGDRQTSTLGIYIRCTEVDIVEFVGAAPEEESNGQSG